MSLLFDSWMDVILQLIYYNYEEIKSICLNFARTRNIQVLPKKRIIHAVLYSNAEQKDIDEVSHFICFGFHLVMASLLGLVFIMVG